MVSNIAIAKIVDTRILIKGQVFSQEDKSPLAYVNIFPNASNYGTFTNHDGVFELLVHAGDYEKNLVASLVGFRVQTFPMDTSRSYQIFLSPQAQESQESILISVEEIMENFRGNVRSNYPSNPMVNRVFLREYAKIRDKENLYMNEVIVDYLRNGFFDSGDDLMKLIKGRNKIYHPSIPFSYTSGGFNDIQIDIIKYPLDFVIGSKGYNYAISEVIPAEGENIYKIRFEARGKSEYEGWLYIESGNFALVKAEINYSEFGRSLLNKLSKKSGFYWDNLTKTIVYKKDRNDKYNLSEIISEGLGFDYNVNGQLIVTSEILVIETDVATFFANEFYPVEDELSIFEIVFENTPFFWEENNSIVMEDSFREGYN